MKLQVFSALLAALPSALAQHRGTPFGFAAGTTGGGNAAPVYPKTNQEYVSMSSHNSDKIPD